MRTGVSYMGHHNPKHLRTDLEEMRGLGLDDVLLAAQENDFRYYPGKLRETARIALDLGMRPIAIFWGVLSAFGGGRSSLFLLEHQDGLQVNADGSRRHQGCYVNPICVARIKEMIDTIAGLGYQAYFVDEPAALDKCYCPACTEKFAGWAGVDLLTASQEQQVAFRRQCVIDYVAEIAAYCKANHPQLETMCCLMEHQTDLWPLVAKLPGLDNLGSDLYWVNSDEDIAQAMPPLVRQMEGVCRAAGKKHHEWLQCWKTKAGREGRIVEQGQVLVREQPDALYVWAWYGQVGTYEAGDDPALAWTKAVEVLKMAKA